jgi:hypothetical protein
MATKSSKLRSQPSQTKSDRVSRPSTPLKQVELPKTASFGRFMIALIVGLFIWIAAIPFVKQYYYYRSSLGLIKDVKALKKEFEDELGIQLTWENGCMKPQALNDALYSRWSCEISFKSNDDYIYVQENVESYLREKNFVKSVLEDEPPNKGFSFFYDGDKKGPDCGIHFGDGFTYRCGFSVDKLYKNRINTELGLNNKGYQK